jgi:hypothetical protein
MRHVQVVWLFSSVKTHFTLNALHSSTVKAQACYLLVNSKDKHKVTGQEASQLIV